MNKVGLFLLPLLCVGEAFAAAPSYDDDPFGDDDWEAAPLILDAAYPTNGRAELGLMFSSTVIDKYNSHVGGMLDLTYNFTDAMGLNFALGFMHGALTPIVTDPEGIIGNKLKSDACTQSASCDLNPNVPDFDQLTGVATASFVWSPLYGKINVVSELDVNLILYALGGLGVNGSRRVLVQEGGTAAGFSTVGAGVGEGGLFSGAKLHVSAGGGLKVFVAESIDLRFEFRDIINFETFDFGEGEEPYRSHHYLAQVGLGIILF